jgi:hypothetical protein
MMSVCTRSGTARIIRKLASEACGAKTGQWIRLSAALACTARPVAERVQARALRALELEDLEQPHTLVGGCDQPQVAMRVGQHDPRPFSAPRISTGSADRPHLGVRSAGPLAAMPSDTR